MKPLKEKFGDKYWEYSLRSSENPKQGELRTLSIGREMQGLYSKFYQRGIDSMPAVVRKANKLFKNQQNSIIDDGNDKNCMTSVKSQRKLVAFENKSSS